MLLVDENLQLVKTAVVEVSISIALHLVLGNDTNVKQCEFLIRADDECLPDLEELFGFCL